MKLSNVTAKLTQTKQFAAKALAVCILAGAAMVAAPTAQAQQYQYGGYVQYNQPAYSNSYYGYDRDHDHDGYRDRYQREREHEYWEHRRWEEARQREYYNRYHHYRHFDYDHGYGR